MKKNILSMPLFLSLCLVVSAVGSHAGGDELEPGRLRDGTSSSSSDWQKCCDLAARLLDIKRIIPSEEEMAAQSGWNVVVPRDTLIAKSAFWALESRIHVQYATHHTEKKEDGVTRVVFNRGTTYGQWFVSDFRKILHCPVRVSPVRVKIAFHNPETGAQRWVDPSDYFEFVGRTSADLEYENERDRREEAEMLRLFDLDVLPT